MSLPPPEALDKIARVIGSHSNRLNAPEFDIFDKLYLSMTKVLKGLVTTGLDKGLQAGATALIAPSSGLTIGAGMASMTMFTVGAALAPWIGAATIAYQADGIFALNDLKDHIQRRGGGRYSCSCGKCAEGLQYIIDKKEVKVAIVAVSIFTAGVPALIAGMNSFRKKFQKGRPKEMHSKQFCASARDGCKCAIATIMMLSGSWPTDEPPSLELMSETVCIIMAKNGWERLKSHW
jgi:hypothetical protein